MSPLHVVRLYEAIGVEKPMAEIERTLRAYVTGEKPPVVGAHLVTCSDGAEYEVAQVFRREFVRTLLPALHFDDKAPFHTASLGARYEWGSARVAESHFALAKGAEQWKLLAIKINAHVGADALPGHATFGILNRYGKASPCCGALAALLAGDLRPFSEELTEILGTEGVDRLAQLRALPEDHRALFAAITSARLQARRAMLDVQDHEPETPTVTLILPCVSFNRHHHDTEMLLGVYVCDRRGEPHDEYCGLGDRPAQYKLSPGAEGVRVEDPQMRVPRVARNHRRLIRDAWQARRGEAAIPRNSRLEAAVQAARNHDRTNHTAARLALSGLLGVAATVAPVPAALALFGEGALAIHHTSRAHRVLSDAKADPAARRMLQDVHARIEHLAPVEAQNLVELLVEEYGRA